MVQRRTDCASANLVENPIPAERIEDIARRSCFVAILLENRKRLETHHVAVDTRVEASHDGKRRLRIRRRLRYCAVASDLIDVVIDHNQLTVEISEGSETEVPMLQQCSA